MDDDGVRKGESTPNMRRLGENGERSTPFNPEPPLLGVVRCRDGVRNVSGFGNVKEGSSGWASPDSNGA